MDVTTEAAEIQELIQELIQERRAARRGGNIALANAIAEELEELGVTVMDTPYGTTCKPVDDA